MPLFLFPIEIFLVEIQFLPSAFSILSMSRLFSTFFPLFHATVLNGTNGGLIVIIVDGAFGPVSLLF